MMFKLTLREYGEQIYIILSKKRSTKITFLGYVYMNIRRLSREDIDKTKWDSCVHFATNGNIFGYKWYIDAITKDWEVLVEGDYESVMPLIWKKNWLGKKQIYLPTLMRETGIYSANALSPKRVTAFLDAIPQLYKKVSLEVDQFTLPPQNQNWQIEKKENHLVYLNKSYEQLSAHFSKEVLAGLDKARTSEIQSINSLKPEMIVDFYKKHDPSYTKENYYAYLRIMYNLLHRGWGFMSGVADKTGQLLAVNFFLFSHGRMVSFLPVVSKKGITQGAMEFLFNLLFHTNANKQMILDFNKNDRFLGYGETAAPVYGFTKK